MKGGQLGLISSVQLLKQIPYNDVVEVEQQLINEGLPEEEVLKFCDIHTQVLEGHIDQSGSKEIPKGHPALIIQIFFLQFVLWVILKKQLLVSNFK